MQVSDWLLQHGNKRFVVPLPLHLALFSVPTALLALSLTSTKLPPFAKQLLSILPLVMVVLNPIMFSCGNGLFDIGVASLCYNLFLRLFELHWIGPMLYGKPVYVDRTYLYTEFWSCLRNFPKSNKKSDDDPKPKEDIKNKKTYNLILKLAKHLIVSDVIGSWLTTFTGNEVITLRQTNPALYLVFLIMTVLVLNSVFNLAGYSLHLIHCLYYDGGSYSEEQWHPLINNPILSTSLQELWSERWHQIFHSTWVAFAFRPTRHIMQHIFTKSAIKNPKPIVFILASLAVFLTSGVMHEYMILTNVGWSVYASHFAGQQTLFFLIHGVGVIIEQLIVNISLVPVQLKESFLVRQVLQRVWVITWAYFTFQFLIAGFTYNEVWNNNPVTFTRPYLTQLLRTMPNGHVLCGSLL